MKENAKKILFSPVGGTDPMALPRKKTNPADPSNTIVVSPSTDAAMLHIIRYQKPDHIILYFTHEICENEREDQRYTKAIEYISQLLKKEITYEIIYRENLTDPHNYNYFYKDFGSILKKIMDKKGDKEVILNITSGTPAMKTALLVLQHLWSSDCKLYQVSTPQRAMNNPIKSQYHLKEAWKLNIDNTIHENWDGENFSEDFTKKMSKEKLWLKSADDDNIENIHSNMEDSASEDCKNLKKENANPSISSSSKNLPENRCEEVQCTSLILLKNLELLKKLINSFDYSAALKMLQSLEGDYEKIKRMIELAKYRLLLDFDRVDDIFKKLEAKDKKNCYRKYKDINRRKYFEYVQMLEVKYKMGHYGDFIRAVTPIIFDCYLLIINEQLKIDVFQDLCEVLPYKNAPTWSKEKLESNDNTIAKINNILNPSIQNPNSQKKKRVYGNYLTSHELFMIIKKLLPDNKRIRNTTNFLRTVETKIRNIAAHQIVSITEETIESQLVWDRKNRGCKDILREIKKALTFGGLDLFMDNTGSYRTMNKEINKVIDSTIEDDLSI